MNFFKKIWGVVFGDAGGGIIQPIADVYKVKAENDGKEIDAGERDLETARQFAAPGSAPGMINILVDAANRIIRPFVTVYVLGGLADWWKLPDLEDKDPLWILAGATILVFWFGGRMLFKDLPAGLALALSSYFKARGKG